MREELRKRLREIIREYEDKYGSFENLERKVQRGAASLEELDDYSGWKATQELLRKVGGGENEKG